MPYNLKIMPKLLIDRCCGADEDESHHGRVDDLEIPRRPQNGVPSKPVNKVYIFNSLFERKTRIFRVPLQTRLNKSRQNGTPGKPVNKV